MSRPSSFLEGVHCQPTWLYLYTFLNKLYSESLQRQASVIQCTFSFKWRQWGEELGERNETSLSYIVYPTLPYPLPYIRSVVRRGEKWTCPRGRNEILVHSTVCCPKYQNWLMDQNNYFIISNHKNHSNFITISSLLAETFIISPLFCIVFCLFNFTIRTPFHDMQIYRIIFIFIWITVLLGISIVSLCGHFQKGFV